MPLFRGFRSPSLERINGEVCPCPFPSEISAIIPSKAMSPSDTNDLILESLRDIRKVVTEGFDRIDGRLTRVEERVGHLEVWRAERDSADQTRAYLWERSAQDKSVSVSVKGLTVAVIGAAVAIVSATAAVVNLIQ